MPFILYYKSLYLIEFCCTGDKEILKLALKSDVLNVDEIALHDKNVLNLYGVVNLFKSSLSKDIALFRAFAGYKDSEMIKGLIGNKGFKIESEVQFAEELVRATDEIFQVSISALQKVLSHLWSIFSILHEI